MRPDEWTGLPVTLLWPSMPIASPSLALAAALRFLLCFCISASGCSSHLKEQFRLISLSGGPGPPSPSGLFLCSPFQPMVILRETLPGSPHCVVITWPEASSPLPSPHCPFPGSCASKSLEGRPKLEPGPCLEAAGQRTRWAWNSSGPQSSCRPVSVGPSVWEWTPRWGESLPGAQASSLLACSFLVSWLVIRASPWECLNVNECLWTMKLRNRRGCSPLPFYPSPVVFVRSCHTWGNVGHQPPGAHSRGRTHGLWFRNACHLLKLICLAQSFWEQKRIKCCVLNTQDKVSRSGAPGPGRQCFQLVYVMCNEFLWFLRRRLPNQVTSWVQKSRGTKLRFAWSQIATPCSCCFLWG